MGILFQVLFLGLLGGANPGPILASAFTEAFRKGFARSLRVIFMALIAESIVAFLILFVLFSFNIPEILFYLVSFVGAGILIWIAVQIWKIQGINDEEEIFTFEKIFFLTLFNGPFWIFWITICVPQAFFLKEKISGGQFIFLILFELGWLIATLFLTFLFSRFRKILARKNLTPIIFKFFSILLLLFASKLILQSGSFLINKFWS